MPGITSQQAIKASPLRYKQSPSSGHISFLVIQSSPDLLVAASPSFNLPHCSVRCYAQLKASQCMERDAAELQKRQNEEPDCSFWMQNQPAELYQQYQTIEYQTASPKAISPPAYVFVIDTCVAEDELSACRAALTKALQTLPEYTQVGLITYGTHVHVHELGFSECSKSYVFQVRETPLITITLNAEKPCLMKAAKRGCSRNTKNITKPAALLWSKSASCPFEPCQGTSFRSCWHLPPQSCARSSPSNARSLAERLLLRVWEMKDSTYQRRQPAPMSSAELLDACFYEGHSLMHSCCAGHEGVHNPAGGRPAGLGQEPAGAWAAADAAPGAQIHPPAGRL